jgi:GMP synthase-like glutamine amidotransferase
MRIHYLQHASFEGMSCLQDWFLRRRHLISGTHLYRGDTLPGLDTFDWLVILGGPMGVHDTDQFPWLVAEKQLIRDAMAAGKIVLGICLGGQLMAHVLGAEVKKNTYKEIGWFPITRRDEVETSALKGIFPKQMNMFHWHGDTFAIPAGATPLASSAACANQGYVIGDRIVGLQCHPETTPQFIEYLARAGMDELAESSPYIQTREQLFADDETYRAINRVMYAILEKLESTFKN